MLPSDELTFQWPDDDGPQEAARMAMDGVDLEVDVPEGLT